MKINTIYNKLNQEEQEELLQEFNLYSIETGWEDWMNEYIEEDYESISAKENEEIEKKQAENFLKNKLNI